MTCFCDLTHSHRAQGNKASKSLARWSQGLIYLLVVFCLTNVKFCFILKQLLAFTHGRYYVSAGKHGKHGCRKPDWLYLSPIVPGSCHRIKSDISGKLDSLEEWFGGLKSLAVLEPEVGLYPPLHLPLGELPFPLMPHFLLYKEGTTIQISNLFYFLPPWVQSFERSCLDRK